MQRPIMTAILVPTMGQNALPLAASFAHGGFPERSVKMIEGGH